MNKKYIQFTIFFFICFVQLSSCQSQNEADLHRIFLESEYSKDASENILKRYDPKGVKHQSIYNAIFEASSPLRPFEETNSKTLLTQYTNNKTLLIQNKEGSGMIYFLRSELPIYNQNQNFEVEAELTSNYHLWEDDHLLGLGINATNYGGAYFIGVINKKGKRTFQVYKQENKKFKKIIDYNEVATNTLKNILTIRKVENKVSFFIDKVFIGMDDYNGVNTPPSVSIAMPKNKLAIVEISNISISSLLLENTQ